MARRVLQKFNLDKTYTGTEEATGEDYNVEADDEGPRPFTALLDTGLKRTSTGSKVFAALKVCQVAENVANRTLTSIVCLLANRLGACSFNRTLGLPHASSDMILRAPALCLKAYSLAASWQASILHEKICFWQKQGRPLLPVEAIFFASVTSKLLTKHKRLPQNQCNVLVWYRVPLHAIASCCRGRSAVQGLPAKCAICGFHAGWT